MPAPRNTSEFTDWPSPRYVGARCVNNTQAGQVTLHGEDPNQVLTYYGRKSVGRWDRVEPVLANPPGFASLLASSRSSLEADFDNNQGSVSLVDAVRARNKAYSKFLEAAVGPSTALGVFAAERREAYGMIANRALGLYHAYKDLRKGKFREALRRLSVSPKRKHRNLVRNAAHEASGLWLEYWFGWSPTVQDMFNAVDVLGRDYSHVPVSGSSGCRLSALVTSSSSRSEESAVYICKTGAHLRLVNSDLFLAQQLGLINPLEITWELVPFSFVVDWFISYGDVLGAFSDLAGLECTYQYQTHLLLKSKRIQKTSTSTFFPQGKYHEATFLGRRMQRKVGLINPQVVFPRLENFGKSRTRAATAVSLLTQLFLTGR